MSSPPTQISTASEKPGKPRGKGLRFVAWGCATLLIAFGSLVLCGFFLLSKVPKSYPAISNPLPPPQKDRGFGGGLAHFDSPYLGHTGSWDGKGGEMFGHTKEKNLEIESKMGLRWTFMPVYWRALEPKGPVDLGLQVPPQWQELDRFVIAAHGRGLNILMQAPVMGGNAEGPPDWAGRVKPGRSAPKNMEAAAAFAARLAARYRPGGTLALREKWGSQYGVRAWELDNEPESYRTSWKDQAAEYAEFATKTAAAIKKVDPDAVIVCPGMAGGEHGLAWLEQTLGPEPGAGKRYSLGPVTDVVSFHCYEGLETAISGEDRTIERDFLGVRNIFEKYERRVPGFEYTPKQDFWHTEGNFDFLGVLSQERRAAWRFQVFTRAFVAGIRKVCVMDASPPEQIAVRAYIEVLPDPFPMLPADKDVQVRQGKVTAFMHPDAAMPDAGRVWVIWAVADSGDAIAEIPVRQRTVTCVGIDGRKTEATGSGGKIRLELKGDKKMPPGVLVLDRP
jgi:hypothetical protein